MSADSASPGLLLAVDGGQSSTLALLSQPDGQIIAVGHGGPANHIHEPGGPERLASAMRNSTRSALDAAGVPDEAVTHICLGMTGAMTQAQAIVEELYPHAVVTSYHDVFTALVGASLSKQGVVVIAGTGAIAYGRLDDGRDVRSSGWGYTMGDEGGGYWLGIEAIRAACKAYDGRAEPTTLVERILQHFGVDDLYALWTIIYSQQLPRAQIASLAAVVAAAATAGDAAAVELFRRAAGELAEAALAVIDRLGQTESGLNVYVTGGVFYAGALISEPFAAAIARRSPRSIVHNARYSPVVGSLILALDSAGIALDDTLLAHLKATLPPEALLKRPERN
jgi:N-acetylglucosamine kinase-like BadF-type ATPase